METATRVIAWASVVNLVVLSIYAIFTWGIWRQTRETARRTGDLVQQARDALKHQILTSAQVAEDAFRESVRGLQLEPRQISIPIRTMRNRLGRVFPEHWSEIEQGLVPLPEELKE